MSGKRLALILALALAVGLMGATKPRYGAYQVTGAGNYGVGARNIETKTYLFKLAPQGAFSMQSRNNTNWVADSTAAANSGGIINLPADSVAWDDLTYRDTLEGTLTNGTQDSVGLLDSWLVSQGDATVAKYPIAISTRIQRFGILRMPIQHYIPRNHTVTSAYLRLISDATNTGWGGNSADSLFCVLNNNVNDWAWWNGPITAGDSTYVRRAASWKYQIQPARGVGFATAGHGYPARASFPSTYADSFAWNPPLASRIRPYDFGIRGVGYCPLGATVTDGYALSVDIKRPAQHIVSGAVNNGLWIMATDDAANGAATVDFSVWGDGIWTSVSTDSLSNPYIVVTTTTAGYSGGPWGGEEVAFSFVADLATKAAVAAWEPIFHNRGFAMTMAPSGGHALNPGATYCTLSDLAGYFARGNEIATQSRYWDLPTGTGRGFAEQTYTAAGWDSLGLRMSPAWLDSGLALNDGIADRDSAYYAEHPLVGKTIVCPNNYYTLNAILVADSLGIVGLRTSLSASVGPKFAPATGDTAGAQMGTSTVSRRCLGLKSPRLMNTMLLPARFNDSSLFGTDGAAVTDSAVIKRIVRIMIEDAAYKYNEPMILYAHDLNVAGGTFSGGFTEDQIRWTMNAIADAGNVRVMTLADMARYMKANMAAAVAHPAYGSARWQAQADGFHQKGN